MSKVYPLQDMHVGGPNGGYFLRTTKGLDSEHPLVKERPELFTDPEFDPRDKEIADLKALLAEVQSKPKRAGA